MPGSKRRALKKLLSPEPTPAQAPPTSTSPEPISASPKHSSSFSSLLHPLHKHKSSSSTSNGNVAMNGNGNGTGHAAGDISQSSIASNPANYMSDQALQEDLAVEEGLNGSVGAGVGGTGGRGAVPPPVPPGGMFGGDATEQVTAEQLMGFEGQGNGGKKSKKSSKQRFEERQARKRDNLLNSAPPSDPAWTQQLEKERQEEIQVMSHACQVMDREIFEIAPDGHCMFNAITDQLFQIGVIPAQHANDPKFARRKAADYIFAHKDDFLPFLPSITGEDSAGATEDGVMTEKDFKQYCKNVAETGEWGGEPEIQALSRSFQVPIHVFQRGPPTVVSHGGLDDTAGGALTPEQSEAQGDRVVRITYHRRMYGLGEHYNSLRKAGA